MPKTLLVAVLRVDAASGILNLCDASVETKALLVGVTGVLSTSSNPDAPRIVEAVVAGSEVGFVLTKDEVARLVDLPALGLGVARIRLSAGVLKNTLTCINR